MTDPHRRDVPANSAHRPGPDLRTPYPHGPFVPAGPAGGPPKELLGDVGKRLLARIVDGVLVVVVLVATVLPFVFAATALEDDGPAATALVATGIVLGLLLALAYEPWTTGRYGRTPGKRLYRLEVVRLADGGRIGHGRSWARALSGLVMGQIPFLGLLDVLWCLWDGDRQCLHDKAAGTVVVRSGPSR
ncbi:RDD family protein [Streptomyces sp. HB2AG]|uniref:RDD family protein n=1 Tax=Streptomyces sp. HB2AG TaxID=2983400 RepID=UPI0022A9FD22|nr:RDD family protein [Streptomyces sp. HB2AG]MCZ2523390.1 RDD family protein [Streptomyces sp. HB2AG]